MSGMYKPEKQPLFRRARLCVLGVVAMVLLTGCRPEPEIVIREMPTAAPAVVERSASAGDPDYILNPGTLRFHRPDCSWAARIDPERRIDYAGDRQTLLDVGYQPCHFCKP